MRGKTHLMLGVLLALLGYEFFSLSLLAILFLVLGSLFPDIDSSTSLLGRRMKIVGQAFEHRGFFHSFIAVVLFSLLVTNLFGQIIGLSFGIGYLSHLGLDMLTKAGVRVHPFKWRINGPFKSGGFMDSAMFVVFFLASAVLVLGISSL